jgi:DNA-binding transcriptional regulator YiaG
LSCPDHKYELRQNQARPAKEKSDFLLTSLFCFPYPAGVMAASKFDLSQMTFGELLRLWRRRKGLSQADVAALLEPVVHQTTVSYWEADFNLPNGKHLSQLLRITGIPPELALVLTPREESQP